MQQSAVPMVRFDWLEDQYQVLEEWRSASTGYGAQSVILVGAARMQLSLAGNWVILHLVNL